MRRHKVSERRACRVVGQHRSAQRYVPMPNDFETLLVKAMRQLAEDHPRWGYRQIHALLVADGWKVNRKRVERLWRREGLQVPPAKKKRKGKKAGGSDDNSIWNLPSVYPDHIWTLDFVGDRTVDGRSFRILNILDEYTRFLHHSHVARTIGARSVRAVLSTLFAAGHKPAVIRSDNGPEFVGHELAEWLKEQGVESAFVAPGSPQQNAFIESLNGTMRDECLNLEEFHSVLEARVVIGEYRRLYNTVRRHRALAMKAPAVFRVAELQAADPPCNADASSPIGKTYGGSKKRGR